MSHPHESLPHRPELTGVRGLAILLVVVCHAFLYTELRMDNLNVLRTLRAGWAGVDLFFVLSGFLITRILLNTKGKARYFRNFYARRALRILPIYFLFLILMFFVLPHFALPEYLKAYPKIYDYSPWYWLLVQNWLPVAEGVFLLDYVGHTWTLAVEEQFYLLWPFLVLFLSVKQLRIFCLTGIIAVLAWRTYWVLDLNSARALNPYTIVQNFYTIYFNSSTRVDTLMLGSLLATLVNPATLSIRPVAGGKKLLLLSGCLAVASAILIFKPYVQTVGYTFIGIFFFLLVWHVLAEPESSISSILRSRFFINLGTYSYALYLIHEPLMRLIYVDLGVYAFFESRLGYIGGSMASGIVSIIPAYLLAVLSWHFFEKRILKLKAHFH